MLRSILGFFGKAGIEEQRALLIDCESKLTETVCCLFGDEYRDIKRWEAFIGDIKLEPLLAMKGGLSEMTLQLVLAGRPLRRSQVAILRQWQHDLTLARQRAVDMVQDEREIQDNLARRARWGEP
jgi:hypothetical protein